MSQNDIRYLTPINIEIKKDKYCRFKKSGIKFIDFKDANFLLRLVNAVLPISLPLRWLRFLTAPLRALSPVGLLTAIRLLWLPGFNRSGE